MQKAVRCRIWSAIPIYNFASLPAQSSTDYLPDPFAFLNDGTVLFILRQGKWLPARARSLCNASSGNSLSDQMVHKYQHQVRHKTKVECSSMFKKEKQNRNASSCTTWDHALNATLQLQYLHVRLTCYRQCRFFGLLLSPSWKPVSDEGSTARLVCIEDDCQVLKGHRVSNSLSTDSQGLLIKLHNNTELEWGRSPGWTECMSFCRR